MSPPSVHPAPLTGLALRQPSLLGVYEVLLAEHGHETWHWAPSHIAGPMDVVAGAVLVQHTGWANAERALEALRAAGALDPVRLGSMPRAELAALVRVSGTPTVKARRLQALAATIVAARGLQAFLALNREDLRELLLETHGIGPETADAILLYAAGHLAFVVDAYTKRMFRRIGAGPAGDGYDAWQRYFEHGLTASASVDLYRAYHACIVLHSKAVCRAVPRCGECALRPHCATGASVPDVAGPRDAGASR